MLVYHYCDTDKLKSILHSKQFWLADLTKSNDENEVIQTFKIFWGTIKERLLKTDIENIEEKVDLLDKNLSIQHFVDSPYGVCFSIEGNLKSQWDEYGDSKKGFSLGFDTSWFQHIKNDMPHPSSNIDSAIGFYPIIYYGENVEDGLFNVCCEIMKQYNNALSWMTAMCTLRHYSAFIKDDFYRDEREYRIAYYPDEQHDYEQSKIGLSPLEITPFNHYCLPWAINNENKALKQVILGPLCPMNQSEVLKLLQLESVDMDVEIIKSNAPYRLSNNK